MGTGVGMRIKFGFVVCVVVSYLLERGSGYYVRGGRQDGKTSRDARDLQTKVKMGSCQGTCSEAGVRFSVYQSSNEASERIDELNELLRRNNLYVEEIYKERNGEIDLAITQKVRSAIRDLKVIDGTEDWYTIEERLYRYSAIGQVIYAKEEKVFVCTGTLVSRNAILTAAHCALDGDGNLLSDIWFVPNKIGTQVRQEGKVVGGWAVFGPSNSYINIAENDWAFLWLDTNLGDKYGYISMDDPSLSAGDKVTVSGYAVHSHCSNGKILCEGSSPLLETSLFEYSYTVDTEGGSSGGPVMYKSAGNYYSIVGVHVRGSLNHNEGIPAAQFLPEWYYSQNQFFDGSATKSQRIPGIICQEHSDCGPNAYCTKWGGCFRCDKCLENSDSYNFYCLNDCEFASLQLRSQIKVFKGSVHNNATAFCSSHGFAKGMTWMVDFTLCFGDSSGAEFGVMPRPQHAFILNDAIHSFARANGFETGMWSGNMHGDAGYGVLLLPANLTDYYDQVELIIDSFEGQSDDINALMFAQHRGFAIGFYIPGRSRVYALGEFSQDIRYTVDVESDPESNSGQSNTDPGMSSEMKQIVYLASGGGAVLVMLLGLVSYYSWNGKSCRRNQEMSTTLDLSEFEDVSLAGIDEERMWGVRTYADRVSARFSFRPHTKEESPTNLAPPMGHPSHYANFYRSPALKPANKPPIPPRQLKEASMANKDASIPPGLGRNDNLR